MLESMQPHARRNWTIPALLAGVLVVLLAILAVLLVPHLHGSAKAVSGKPASSPRAVRNIAQPNPKCQDQPDAAFVRQWEVDGWWVGYVNGHEKELTGGEALQLQIQGAAVDRVWLCPSKSAW
jgi:hypothetical protein